MLPIFFKLGKLGYYLSSALKDKLQTDFVIVGISSMYIQNNS